MRIYNGTNSLIDLPITNRVRLTIPAHSVSKEFMPSDDFINLIVRVYQSSDIALIISGPYELNMCAKNPSVTPLIVHTLDEAVIRFNGPSAVDGDQEEARELIPEMREEEQEFKGEPDSPTPEPEPESEPEVSTEQEIAVEKPKKKRSKKN